MVKVLMHKGLLSEDTLQVARLSALPVLSCSCDMQCIRVRWAQRAARCSPSKLTCTL